MLDCTTRLDLKLRVLLATQGNLPLGLNCIGWNEPASSIADESEEIIDKRGIKCLGRFRPALIPTIGADTHAPPLVAVRRCHRLRRGLHLHSQHAPLDLRHQIDVRAVAEGDPDERSLARQSLHCGELAEVSLDPAVDQALAMLGFRRRLTLHTN
jgi:hypothetical protein